MFLTLKRLYLAITDWVIAFFARYFPKWHLESRVNSEIRRVLEQFEEELNLEPRVSCYANIDGSAFYLENRESKMRVKVTPDFVKVSGEKGPIWAPYLYVQVSVKENEAETGERIVAMLISCLEQFEESRTIINY